MVVIIKLENSTYFMTATVAPVCYGFMFQSVVVVVVLLLCFLACVWLSWRIILNIMTVATICYVFMYLSDFVDGFVDVVVVLCLAVHRVPRRCK